MPFWCLEFNDTLNLNHKLSWELPLVSDVCICSCLHEAGGQKYQQYTKWKIAKYVNKTVFEHKNDTFRPHEVSFWWLLVYVSQLWGNHSKVWGQKVFFLRKCILLFSNDALIQRGNKEIYNVTNVFYFILEWFDWSNDAENSALHHRNKWHLQIH